MLRVKFYTTYSYASEGNTWWALLDMSHEFCPALSAICFQLDIFGSGELPTRCDQDSYLVARTNTKRSGKTNPAKTSNETKGPAQNLFQGQDHPKKSRKLVILNQWIEIEIEDGRTVTKLYPSNEQLIKEGKAMLPAPDLIYRRLNFPTCVPPEYRWATRNPQAWERGGTGIQRMTVDTWLRVIEREKALGTGHVGPTGVGSLPRPAEHGECECEVCQRKMAKSAEN